MGANDDGSYSTHHGWTDPRGVVWQVRFDWRVHRQRLEPMGMALRVDEDPAATVTSTLLREVPLAQLLRDGVQQASWSQWLAEDLPAGPKRATARAVAGAWPDGRTYRHLRAAVTYARAWASGDSGPVKAVMRDLKVARSTAGRYIEVARNEYRFLSSTDERKANGELAPAALELLERFGDDWEAWEAHTTGDDDGER